MLDFVKYWHHLVFIWMLNSAISPCVVTAQQNTTTSVENTTSYYLDIKSTAQQNTTTSVENTTFYYLDIKSTDANSIETLSVSSIVEFEGTTTIESTTKYNNHNEEVIDETTTMVQSTLDVIFTNSTTLSHQTVLPRLTTNADNDSVVVVVPQSKSNKTTTSNAVLDCPPIFESKPEQLLDNITATLDDALGKIDELKSTITSLTRQFILQQMYAEERIRSEGHSGIKQIRTMVEGTRPYFSPSHSGNAVAAMHDHANNIRTVGIGELVAVINGVEFRTRHNDYRLLMPSTKSTQLHATEEIAFPPVPPEVKGSVKNQILEMRKYFKAWQNDDISERDYRPYFKPVLCYMEGAWFNTDGKVVESFVSDRHHIDAETWKELEDIIHFLSYSGAKHTLENVAFLPKIIINQTIDGLPIFAQWNYRILCNPIKKHLPLNRLRVVDDLKARLVVKKDITQFARWRQARFQLNTVDRAYFKDQREYNWLLEELMAEIPGKDNYMGNLTDQGYAGVSVDPNDLTHLNAAYYHRKYSAKLKDASGFQTRNRAFSDDNLFMALTTQDKVTGMENMNCDGDHHSSSNKPHYQCDHKIQKWTYAIPMEIIYLTPLNRWNPYDIEHKEGDRAKFVTAGGRNGKLSKPYNGTSEKKYFITPSEFFDGDEFLPDPADTVPSDAVFILDNTGTRRAVRATGVRIIFPEIQGIGHVRQRYPIMPVFGEGSAVWKELEALQDIVLRPRTFRHMYYEDPFSGASVVNNRHNDNNIINDPGLVFVMGMSQHSSVSQHFHVLMLTDDQRSLLAQGEFVRVTTSQANGHTHSLVLSMDMLNKSCELKYIMCDDKTVCWDHHGVCLINTSGDV